MVIFVAIGPSVLLVLGVTFVPLGAVIIDEPFRCTRSLRRDFRDSKPAMKIIKVLTMFFVMIIQYPIYLLIVVIAAALVYTLFYILSVFLFFRLIFQNCFKCRNTGHNSKKLQEEYEKTKI